MKREDDNEKGKLKKNTLKKDKMIIKRVKSRKENLFGILNGIGSFNREEDRMKDRF